MISYYLRDIGGYRGTVGYICYHVKEPWGNVNGDRAESICRLTHVIPSMLVKDHTIVGTSIEIKRMPLT